MILWYYLCVSRRSGPDTQLITYKSDQEMGRMYVLFDCTISQPLVPLFLKMLMLIAGYTLLKEVLDRSYAGASTHAASQWAQEQSSSLRNVSDW